MKKGLLIMKDREARRLKNYFERVERVPQVVLQRVNKVFAIIEEKERDIDELVGTINFAREQEVNEFRQKIFALEKEYGLRLDGGYNTRETDIYIKDLQVEKSCFTRAYDFDPDGKGGA